MVPTVLDLARLAYEAYGESTGGKTFDGRQMPDWDDLGEKIQTAWVAAAGAVFTAIVTPPAEEA